MSKQAAGDLVVLHSAEVDSGVGAIGIRVDYNTVACAGIIKSYGVAANRVGDVSLLALPDAPTGKFAYGSDREFPKIGQTFGLQGRTYMGSVMQVARSYAAKDGMLYKWASVVASSNVAHELSHIADKITIGEEALDNETARYEARKARVAVVPDVLGMLAGLVVFAGIEAYADHKEAPLWVKCGIGVLAVSYACIVGKRIIKSKLPAAKGKAKSSAKGYQSRPEERRARRRQNKYTRDLLRGKATLLVRVGPAAPTRSNI